MQLATLSMFLKISQIVWFLRSEDDDVPSLSHLAEEAAAFLFFSYFFLPLPLFLSCKSNCSPSNAEK